MLDYKKLSPTVLFIFGGSGDLNYRKLNPALYNLFLDNAMPDHFSIVGIGRSEFSDADYKKKLKEGIDQFSRIKDTNGTWKEFSKHLSYLKMDATNPEEYKKLSKIAKEKEDEAGNHPNVIFYMAVAPQLVPQIVKNIATMKECQERKYTRIVVEKPFGHDLKSARDMNQMLLEHFEEEQIYRIDHYLGKETVQNIMVVRFANDFLEPIWNSKFIDHIEISVLESLGAGERANFYDAIRRPG